MPWKGWGANRPFPCPECEVSLRFREPGVLEQIAWQTGLVILAPLLWRRGLVEIVGRSVPQATALRTSPDGGGGSDR